MPEPRIYINSRHVQLGNSDVGSQPNDHVAVAGSRDQGVARREDGVADGFSLASNRRTEGRQGTATPTTFGREGIKMREAVQILSTCIQ